MTAINVTSVIGLNSNVSVGNNGTVNASGGEAANPTTRLADDLVQTGDSNALAGSTNQVGVLNSTITTGELGTINVSEFSGNIAKAKTTSGNSTATAINYGPTGGIHDNLYTKNDIKIGTDSTVDVNIDNLVQAQAESIGGSANATADVGQKIGLFNIDIAAGLGKSLNVRVNATTDAKATAVGQPGIAPPIGNATATSGGNGSRVVGIYNTGSSPDGSPLKVSFGDSAIISAITGTPQAPVSISSNAKTTTGDALSLSRAFTVAGISSDNLNPVVGSSPLPSNKLDISIGATGRLEAAGYLNTQATAKTTTGNSIAGIGIGTVAGVADERVLRGTYNPDPNSTAGSTVTIGNDGAVLAEAIAGNVAEATSTTAPATAGSVSAIINNDYVVGIAVDKLHVGENATIRAQAVSTQSATASTVSSGVDPIATVADGDQVLGISNTDIFAGKNLIGLVATAQLTGRANANSVGATAGTYANAGNGSSVVGFNQGSLNGGENVVGSTGALGDIQAIGNAELSAGAVAVSGPAEARAGGNSAKVIGLESAPVNIGLGGRKLIAQGNGSFSATAITNTGNALAVTDETGRGIQTSPITIGESGTIDASSVLTGNSTSEAVTGNATSSLLLNAAGIKQQSEKIGIGAEGNVFGTAAVIANPELGSIAKTTTGIASAFADISSKGIEVGSTQIQPSIGIGQKGDVEGIGLIGQLAPGNELAVTGPLKVISSNTNGPSTAVGIFDAAGITGPLESGVPTTIKAGPLQGNIIGRGESNGSVLATTKSGPALANTSATVHGISNANLVGGQVGSNLIDGNAKGTFDTKSAATTGDSNASSIVDVFGLLGNGNTISLSGNLNAIAELSNTVTATTITGNASATAGGSVVGLQGYDVNILGSGIITASAISNTVAIASTVTTV